MRQDLKYIYWPDFRHEELYDLRGDSLEERNLAQDVAHAKTLASLRLRFAELKARAK